MEDLQLADIKHLITLVQKENKRQILKWGIQNRDINRWVTITLEEFGETAKAILEYDPDSLVHTKEKVVDEAIQTATLCLKIAEMFLHLKDKPV